MQNKPFLIALCGHPGSGKSSVQDILHANFAIEPIDDGSVLRKHCSELFDIDYEDLCTQEGKKKITKIQGKDWENRKVIGEYGNALEQMFGAMIVPEWAVRKAQKEWQQSVGVMGYSFESVRRDQAAVYRREGGIVVEINRPGVGPTGNIWDLWNKDHVTHRIVNDGNSLSQLSESVRSLMNSILSQDRKTA